jgi:L-serine dehydratase
MVAMNISIFDLFSIGVGPSSSHTVGPMKAALSFINQLQSIDKLNQVTEIFVDLYGSLALTGKGHGTDGAILAGLEKHHPRTVEPNHITSRMEQIKRTNDLLLGGTHSITFVYNQHIRFNINERLPFHTNGLKFTALNRHGEQLAQEVFYSTGGGFILNEKNLDKLTNNSEELRFPFSTAQELLDHCMVNHLKIHEIMLANEQYWRSIPEIHQELLHIAQTMEDCINCGCQNEGYLPGGLHVKRRAPTLYQNLLKKGRPNPNHPDVMNWLNVYAMAVNEENAAGGRIVTAPTNGAAGIIPSVMMYYKNFCPEFSEAGIINFLLTAGAIAILYKKGASISGAEVGCQGEVGVACSMAAGALTAALGGSVRQIEKAAEIGMEHNLGLTCDPIGGLVQIPCIERNAMGTVKAVNAARLVLAEDEGSDTDGDHKVSLDNVISTMRQIGKDMMPIYKETSLGGLAKLGGVSVNIIEC